MAMDMSGFLTSLATSLLVFFLLLLAFHFLSSLRPNAVIYRPIHILHQLPHHDHHTPDAVLVHDAYDAHCSIHPAAAGSRPLRPNCCSRIGFFAWILNAWSASQDQIIQQQTGLDAAVYLIFLTSALRIIALTAAFCVPVLLAVAGTDDNYERQKAAHPTFVFSSFDRVSAGNVKAGSRRLWCFVLGAYWMSGVTLWVLWGAYEKVIGLRARWYWGLRSAPWPWPEQFVVLVRDIRVHPAAQLDEENRQRSTVAVAIAAHQLLRRYFSHLRPHAYSTSLLLPDTKRMNELWHLMEKQLYAYKSAELAATAARSRTLAGSVGGIAAPAVLQQRSKVININDAAMEQHAAEVRRLCREMEDEEDNMRRRRGTGEEAMAAFAVFKTREAAMAVVAMEGRRGRSTGGSGGRVWWWELEAAPEPREVVWENLAMAKERRRRKKAVADIVVAVTVLFYMIPVAMVSAIISSNSLHIKLQIIGGVSLRRFVQAYIPQLSLLLFLFLLPPLLFRLSAAQGLPSLSQIHRSAATKYFYFIVFNVFLGISLISTFFSSLQHIPTSLPSLLSKSLPPQATFFISFIAIKFFVSYGVHLCRVWPLLLYHCKRVLMYHELPDDDPRVRATWYPPPLKYAVRVPDDMLILTITLCYAIISPIILPFALIYFAIGWLVAKNEILNIIKPRYESWGRMWPHIHNRILASLFLSQLTMLGYFSSKKFPYTALLIPLPVLTVVFAIACHSTYYPSWDYPSLLLSDDESSASSLSPPSVDSILSAYTPKCLQWRQQVNSILGDTALALPPENLYTIVREEFQSNV